MYGFTSPGVVTPSSYSIMRPRNSGTAKPVQDPGFPVGIALRYLWVRGGNSGCFMVVLLI